MNPERINDLLEGYLEGTLADTQRQELKDWLISDGTHRRTFWGHIQQHALLRELLMEQRGVRIALRDKRITKARIPSPEARQTIASTSPSPRVPQPRLRATSGENASPPRRQTSTAAWLALAAGLVGLLGVAALLLTQGFPSRPTLARVTQATTGGVAVCNGHPRACVAGLEVVHGTIVQTDGHATVTISYEDTTQLRIAPRTRLTLQLTRKSPASSGMGGGKRVFLERGALTARVAKQPSGHPMIFATPTVQAKILGTELSIAATPDTTRLEVTEGRVEVVRTADQASVEVGAGQYVMAANQTEMKAQPVSRWTGNAPDWVTDPANSRWIVFGGRDGIAEKQGLALRAGADEGTLEPASENGVDCARSMTASDKKSGYFYIIFDSAENIRDWLGDHALMVTVRYFDAAPGELVIKYDSDDEEVKHDPYPAGVWRQPDGYPNGFKLRGSSDWQTFQCVLQLPRFNRRCHGADFRIDPNAREFALKGVAVTRVPKKKLASTP